MKLLQSLLDNLGALWNTLPKEVPLVTLEQGNGKHTRVTIDQGILYFHSAPYHPGIPVRQELVLDELTAQELLDTVQQMGYTIAFTSEAQRAGIDTKSAFSLLEVRSQALPATLDSYTSNLWRVMYPIYRVLREAEYNSAKALQQLYRSQATGEWLDFWADFFNIKREANEDDQAFSRRFTMWIFNPKTNNVALEELLAYRLQDTNITVRDRAPAEFELVVGTKYIDDARDLHRILQEAKGAGIEYFLNYQADLMEENYPVTMADRHGKSYRQLDGSPVYQLVRQAAEVFRKPTDAGYQKLVRLLAESYPKPTEQMTFIYRYLFSEVFPKASEAQNRGLLVQWAEQVPAPQISVNVRAARRMEDVYTLPPASNYATAFRTNKGRTNISRLLLPTVNPQDTAAITITQGGQVTAQIYV